MSEEDALDFLDSKKFITVELDLLKTDYAEKLPKDVDTTHSKNRSVNNGVQRWAASSLQMFKTAITILLAISLGGLNILWKGP